MASRGPQSDRHAAVHGLFGTPFPSRVGGGAAPRGKLRTCPLNYVHSVCRCFKGTVDGVQKNWLYFFLTALSPASHKGRYPGVFYTDTDVRQL